MENHVTTKIKINILNINSNISHYINGDNMFNGFKTINKDYIYLYLDNNYEFANDISTKEQKQREIIKSSRKFLMDHNINFNNKLYYVSNGVVIGYITKNNLYR